MGSRQLKNRQRDPPSLDDFNNRKNKSKDKKRDSNKKRSLDVKEDSKKSKKQKKDFKEPKKDFKESKKSKQVAEESKEPEVTAEEEKVEAEGDELPEVDYDALAKSSKALFDEEEDYEEEKVNSDEDDEDLQDEFDLEQEYENEEESDNQGIKWSDDDEYSDDDIEKLNMNNIEKLSAKLDKRDKQIEEEAEMELKEENLQDKITDVLLKDEELEETEDLTTTRTRMLEIVKILENFQQFADPTKSRSQYTDRLLKDIVKYFGYTEFLAEKLFQLFSPTEAIEFFESNEVARPITIRTNTLKTKRRDLAQSLVNRGVNLQPIPGNWSKTGLQIFESNIPVGATPEYLSGQYILQAASSFLPCIALDPQENERILDMASAPGGKTTYISAMMKNTGVVFANDFNAKRTKSLIANIHRLGCTNTIVCNYDAREFPKVIGGFDRILLDAPCTGTGVIGKDPNVKLNRTPKDFIDIPHLQKQLLLSAIDSVDYNSKTGGVIVYSTCSVAVDEDEAVIDYALRKRPNVKLVDTGLAIGKEAFTSYRGKKFHKSVSLARRYYPHAYNVDGFFVAKFVKTGPSKFDDNKSSAKEKEYIAQKELEVEGIIADDFAEFDDSEDEKYIEKSKKDSLKKKGINPKAKKNKKD
ncbi:NOL1/NOP2/sun family putative RNA met [Hanseniaspora valbyensis NRRL Y-1626]|uniref:Nucleolar protein 2 n=1 Tax=Hanseniaspora valbyensis NRRL Y-1626 TaxID=766949 RepID=A0A1B7TDX4_9ASCO|nr:NOL1/NOP2/sun family putative RNA met [Hanseniaspora valbyensis NRRL Y-1626]